MTRLHPILPILVVLSGAGTLLTYAILWIFHLPTAGPPIHWVGLFVTVLLTGCFLFIFIASWRWGLPIVTHLPEAGANVALTFDDGPSPDITPRILDTLAAHGARATFFILGAQARRHPDLVRRIAAEGHCLACHGDTHRAMVLMSPAAIVDDIRAALAAIAAACPDAPEPRLVRPPYGFKSPMLLAAARTLGVNVVMWSVDPVDYLWRSSPRIAASVLKSLKPGAIVLMHDGAGRGATADALPEILGAISARGYQAVSLQNLY